MTLEEAYNRLNFWINKFTGAWYTPPELDEVVDSGQMSLFSDLKPKYATSQQVKDSLSPFKQTYNFTTVDTVAGIITVPTLNTYQRLNDITISYLDGSTTRYNQVEVVNEDERTSRLKSQIDPPTLTEPIAEQIGKGIFQLWPKLPNTGFVTFLRRPVKPFFDYTTVSGRVIVYNNAGSTQLEWLESDWNPVLIKSLESIGINLGEQDILNFAQTKATENFAGQNRT